MKKSISLSLALISLSITTSSSLFCCDNKDKKGDYIGYVLDEQTGEKYYFTNLITNNFCSKIDDIVIGSHSWKRSEFNLPIYFIKNIDSIPNDFLSNCTSYNKSLNLPVTCKAIGWNFMDHCTSFNSWINTLELHDLTIIGNFFMYCCTSFNKPLFFSSSYLKDIPDNFLNYCFSFNSIINFSKCYSLEKVGNYFLDHCRSFSSMIIFNDKLKIIGTHFLNYCINYNVDFIVPYTVEEIGGYFFNNCHLFNSCIIFLEHEKKRKKLYIGVSFLAENWSYNQNLYLPKNVDDFHIDDYFMQNCYDMCSMVDFGNFSFSKSLQANDKIHFFCTNDNNCNCYKYGVTIHAIVHHTYDSYIKKFKDNFAKLPNSELSFLTSGQGLYSAFTDIHKLWKSTNCFFFFNEVFKKKINELSEGQKERIKELAHKVENEGNIDEFKNLANFYILCKQSAIEFNSFLKKLSLETFCIDESTFFDPLNEKYEAFKDKHTLNNFYVNDLAFFDSLKDLKQETKDEIISKWQDKEKDMFDKLKIYSDKKFWSKSIANFNNYEGDNAFYKIRNFIHVSDILNDDECFQLANKIASGEICTKDQLFNKIKNDNCLLLKCNKEKLINELKEKVINDNFDFNDCLKIVEILYECSSFNLLISDLNYLIKFLDENNVNNNFSNYIDNIFSLNSKIDEFKNKLKEIKSLIEKNIKINFRLHKIAHYFIPNITPHVVQVLPYIGKNDNTDVIKALFLCCNAIDALINNTKTNPEIEEIFRKICELTKLDFNNFNEQTCSLSFLKIIKHIFINKIDFKLFNNKNNLFSNFFNDKVPNFCNNWSKFLKFLNYKYKVSLGIPISDKKNLDFTINADISFLKIKDKLNLSKFLNNLQTMFKKYIRKILNDSKSIEREFYQWNTKELFDQKKSFNNLPEIKEIKSSKNKKLDINSNFLVNYVNSDNNNSLSNVDRKKNLLSINDNNISSINSFIHNLSFDKNKDYLKLKNEFIDENNHSWYKYKKCWNEIFNVDGSFKNINAYYCECINNPNFRFYNTKNYAKIYDECLWAYERFFKKISTFLPNTFSSKKFEKISTINFSNIKLK